MQIMLISQPVTIFYVNRLPSQNSQLHHVSSFSFWLVV